MSVSGLGANDVHVWSALATGDRNAAIRSTLAPYLGVGAERVPLGRDARGRPVVAGADLSLSVSHSGGRLVIAVCAGRPVGIDIERSREGPWTLLPRHALTPRELGALEEEPATERNLAFLRLWTRKEALLKAAGVGLAIEPREIEVSGPRDSARVLRVPEQLGVVSDWSLTDVALPGFVAAVAVLGPPPLVSVPDARADSHNPDAALTRS